MELKQYQCPNCGASLKASSDSREVICDYCDQHFVVDISTAMMDDTITEIINEKIDVINTQPKRNKLETALIIGVAATVAIISLAMIILAFISPDIFANT